LAATLDFTSFFTMAFLGAAHFFYSWAVFGLDYLYTGTKSYDTHMWPGMQNRACRYKLHPIKNRSYLSIGIGYLHFVTCIDVLIYICSENCMMVFKVVSQWKLKKQIILLCENIQFSYVQSRALYQCIIVP